MPHYPKPFFRKSRQLWYVQRDGRQINLGADREAAFAQYHALMAAPKPAPPPVAHSAAPLVVVLCDKFLDWVQKHRSADTYQWYWWRLQSFCRRYPTLAIDELRPFHVQEWVDAQNIVATTQRPERERVDAVRHRHPGTSVRVDASGRGSIVDVVVGF